MRELSLHGLRWRPLSRPHRTVDGLELTIPAGQTVLLAGASGSGKSTVLRALAGLLDEQAGDLEGQADPPVRPGERGLLLQNPANAMVAATVGRDAAFGPENAALARPEIHTRAAEALDAARVDVDAGREPLATSGGQQQRIALAGALALEPDVLLLDEPTSMLDGPTADAVREAILEVSAGRTLVVADHRLEAWLPHVDRLVVLGEQATILADGDPEQLLTEDPRLLIDAGVSVAGQAADGPVPRKATEPGPVVASLSEVDVRRPGRRPGRGTEPPLLRGMDLALHGGTMTALTGPSGAGKTTLLQVVLGLKKPAAGQVALPERERIASVPQNPEHSFVAPTVRQEVTASPWATDDALAEHLLEDAGLAHLAEANPYTLSGGEQRRLAIIAALAQQPDLLVLDEPTVGLDARRREAVLTLLDRARAEGRAVLVATHDPVLIERADARLDLAGQAAPDPDGAPAHTSDRTPDRRIGPVPRARWIPADALNPLVLSLIGILAAIGSFAVDTWQGGLLALLPTVLLAPLAIRTLGGGLLRLAPILLSAAGLAWTTAFLGDAPSLSTEAWLLGAKEAARITAFVAPGVLALGSVDVTALGDALGGKLRLPARPIAASVAGLVRAGHLGRQWEIITQARVLRGIGSPASPRLLAGATLALLVDALRGAEQQALAMDARGFGTATTRTWALPSPLRWPDALGIGIGVLLLVWPSVAEMLVR
ncbi:ATP-binding cassette domain-containing protein [Brachybacterium muris]|uniref:ABC transporter ATPase n=2 Tax=Brachybacterium TaxID=43668 RepID=A0A022KZ67_9MICO|nr:ATP-binding cassette domain-containing protein [Brachybacterium muris]EYT49969.1 ABC transporter ATPase [Brachybacterium muris UCD-AY4]